MLAMDITFGELRCKEVINTINGKRLGRVSDMVISCRTCRVLGLIVPGDKRIFRSKEDLFIPWKNIVKIGDDVILVQLFISPSEVNCTPNREREDCDRYVVSDAE